jgi:hydrogenase-4 component B
MSALVWLLPLLLPLVAAAVVPFSVGARGWLPPLAPVPALALAIMGSPGPAPDLSWVLFDAQLALDPVGRLLLAMTTIVWMAAGAATRRTDAPGYTSLFLLTLAGNIGLLLAGDVLTLYAGFAVMTFAAYGLVVHERTPAALRAGRVYVVLAVIGEAALLSGLLLAVGEADGATFGEVTAAIADSGRRELLVGLVLAGFGVKAGLVPLHVWLPLAHPAAPVPASAVLSGAMIKAGLIGWLRILPLGDVVATDWSAILLALGLAGAFLAVLVGLLQGEPKVLLAYSSVSQMGLIATLVAVGLAVPEVAVAAGVAAATYAVHHGFAKAALFLGAGLVRSTSDARGHRLVIVGMTIAALSLAGIPFSSGWVAKAATKDVVGALPGATAGRVSLALSLAATGTTLLMARLLWLVRRPVSASAAAERTVMAGALRAPFAALLVAVVGASWILSPLTVPQWSTPSSDLPSLWEGTWPVLAAGALLVGAAVLRGRCSTWISQGRLRRPMIPAGDLVAPVERAIGWLTSRASRVRPLLEAGHRVVQTVQRGAYLAVLPGRGLDRVDRWLTRWRTVGATFVAVGAALFVTLAGWPWG